MTEQALEAALIRAERALARCERAADVAARQGGREQVLRDKVREAIAELDELIQRAEA
jgi:Cdc6-like AAA superfamily ATPase